MNMKIDGEVRLNELRERIRAVRASIVEMLARIDDINLQQIPQVRRDYAFKLTRARQELSGEHQAGVHAMSRAFASIGDEAHILNVCFIFWHEWPHAMKGQNSVNGYNRCIDRRTDRE